MTRIILAALILFLVAPVAGAVIGGYPDTMQLTTQSAGVLVDGIARTLPFTMTIVTNKTGTANVITLPANASIQITFTYNSPQQDYGGAHGPYNLAVVMGTNTQNAVSAGGSVLIQDVAYDVGAGFGVPLSLAGSQFVPPPIGLPPAPSIIGGVAATPATTFYYWVGNAPTPIVGVRMTFVENTGTSTTTFVLATIQNPEPGTIALFGLGLLGGGFAVRRRRRRKA